MPKRNFDNFIIIQRIQNRIHSRNVYTNNATGQSIIHNPQTTDGSSSRFAYYHSGAQTEYYRGLKGGEIISAGGIINIPPAPVIPSPPTNIVATSGNQQVSISFTQDSDGGAAITSYQYSINNGISFIAFNPMIITSPVVITGLTNGTTYSIKLKAINSVGISYASSTISSTPATIPSAPTNLVATPGDSQVSISFTPGFNGGTAIINYQYSIDNSVSFIAFSPMDTTSPVVITGLTNGTTYFIQLKAVNSVGTSLASNTVSAIPVTIPSAPTSLVAISGNQQVSISFTQISDGGSVITNYQYSIDNGATFVAFSPTIITSPVIITGLTNGTTYSIQLKAINSVGSSSASSTVTATPATIPSTPTNLVATAGDQQVSISFTPGSNGGSAITNYQYSIDNGVSFIAFSPIDTTSPVVITGLSNGTTYSIQLKAVNSVGSSSASSTVTATPVTIPSAPTSLVATPGDQQVSISFTPGSNGGSAITNYQYSIDNGVSFIAFSPTIITSPVIITGLTNGTTYSIQLKAINNVGTSLASSTITATPVTIPSAPTNLVATPGDNQLSISFTSGYDGGSAITNYQYSIDNGVLFTAFSPIDTTSPVVITGLTNGTSYSIQLKAINSVGSSSASSTVTATPAIIPSAPTSLVATAGDQQVSISFTPGYDGGSAITNYQYSIDNGVSFTAFSPIDTTSPVVITGLTNGTTYSIQLKAVNSIGISLASSTITATPVTIPSAPTSLVATPGDQQVSISFTPGYNGGSAITNYQYSIDNGVSFTAFSPIDTTSPVVITGLINGTTYSIQLKAVNSIGISLASSTITATPVTIPSAPTSLVATPGDSQLSISFTPGSDGGSAITNYQYSIDNGVSFTAFSPIDTTSPVIITGLTNGTTYSIQLKAVNNVGISPASSTITATPVTIPSAPTSLVATAGDQQVSISFTPGSNGGSAITNYQYSIDNGVSFIAFSPIDTTSPVVITGLTNGTTYSIQLKAVNSVGSSSASSTVTATPVTIPSAPTSLVATPGNQQVSISFTQSSNGGSAISNYQYSIDNGATFVAFSPAIITSPVIITGLTNGTTYSIQLKAINNVGTSLASSTITATPVTIPSAPTNLVATAGDQQVSISFTPGYNGGSAITNYQYSIDNGVSFTAFSPINTTSPVVITGLTNGTTYSIQLKAVNSVGSSSASSTVTATPVTIPSAPTSLVATPGDSQLSISFTPGSDGGSAITNYQYSIDNGVSFIAFSPIDTTSPVVITGLTNGTTYSIQLKAVNSIGTGTASSTITATPAIIPSAPTSLVATAGDQQVSISFTPGYDGGSAITNYQYSIDNGVSFTAFSPIDTTSPVVITGLTNGTTYSIQLKAVNSIGSSSASSTVTATPVTIPSAPTSLVATPGNSQLSISFTPGSDGGSAITNYQYSIDNGVSFTAFSPIDTTSPVVITGLTNGTTYSIQLKAVNSIGTGTASSTIFATPAIIPSAPTNLVATPGNQQVSISFTPGSDGGSAITNYQYSINNGVSFTAFSPIDTTSPVVITGLTNGTSYSIQLKAVNSIGSSSASSTVTATPVTIPSAPTSLAATPYDSLVSISFTPGSNGGSAITNYQYSINNGASFTAFNPIDTTSPVVITGLTKGTSYSIQLRAVNSIGTGTASNTISVTTTVPTQPATPVITSMTGNYSAVTVYFTGYNGGYNGGWINGGTYTAVQIRQNDVLIGNANTIAINSGTTNGYIATWTNNWWLGSSGSSAVYKIQTVHPGYASNISSGYTFTHP